MSAPMHRAFYGDGERDFAITPPLVLELERTVGTGVGGLCQRLFRGDFRHVDVTETIRLGLIGGGEQPETAAALVAAYIPARPMIESYDLAVAILEVLWFGAAVKPKPELAPVVEGTL